MKPKIKSLELGATANGSGVTVLRWNGNAAADDKEYKESFICRYYSFPRPASTLRVFRAICKRGKQDLDPFTDADRQEARELNRIGRGG